MKCLRKPACALISRRLGNFFKKHTAAQKYQSPFPPVSAKIFHHGNTGIVFKSSLYFVRIHAQLQRKALHTSRRIQGDLLNHCLPKNRAQCSRFIYSLKTTSTMSTGSKYHLYIAIALSINNLFIPIASYQI